MKEVKDSVSKGQVVITTYFNRKFLLIYENDELVECHPLLNHTTLQIGNIYIGRVEKVIKNIQSAFVRLDDDHIGYLPLDDANAIVLNRQLPKGLPSISQNDYILVQVVGEPQKMKQARLTSNISMRGNYVVLDLNDAKKGISKKIKNIEVLEKLRNYINQYSFSTTTKDLNILDKSQESLFSFGSVFRTACEDANFDDVITEYNQLVIRFSTMIKKASFERNIGLVYKGEIEYLSILEEYGYHRISNISTDLKDIYDNLNGKFESVQLYQDETYPYEKLLTLDSEFKKIFNKKVWLKSGGFLIIEPTEAMVVIDVNSGKSIGKKRKETHIFETNIEAAKEILRQIRLRNLSGIIMIDFINMEEESHKRELARRIEIQLKQDKVPTYLVEITKLDLFEMTRKKIRKPIYELIKL